MKPPELIVSKWLNTNQNLSLEKLKGKVVAIHAFQMLCPGCILHGMKHLVKNSWRFWAYTLFLNITKECKRLL